MRSKNLTMASVGLLLFMAPANAQTPSFSCERIPGGGCGVDVNAYAEGQNYMYYQMVVDYPPTASDSDPANAAAGNVAAVAIPDVNAYTLGSGEATTTIDVGVSTYTPQHTANFTGDSFATCTPGVYASGASWLGGGSAATAYYKVQPNGTKEPGGLYGVMFFDTYGAPPVGDAGVGYFSMSACCDGSNILITGVAGHVLISGELSQGTNDPLVINDYHSSVYLDKTFEFFQGTHVGHEFDVIADVVVNDGIPYAIYAECDSFGETVSGQIFSLVSHIAVWVED